jgi:flagellar protein FliJ
MSKFLFSLEPVLNYRILVEEGEQQKLQSIDSALQKAQQAKLQLMQESSNTSRLLSTPQGSAIDIESLKNLAAYLKRLQSEIVQSSHIISKLEEDKRVQLDKLIEARKSREIVEKLKEKKINLHEKELQTLEQKLLDDVSAERFLQSSEHFLPAQRSNR